MLKSSVFSGVPRLEQAAADRNQPLAKPESGEPVKRLQKALLLVGQSLPRSTAKGAVDGIFGDETLAAVKAFQAQLKLKVDGMAGPETLQRLDRMLNAPDAGPNHAICLLPPRSSAKLLFNFAVGDGSAAAPAPAPAATKLPVDVAKKDAPDARQWMTTAQLFLLAAIDFARNPTGRMSDDQTFKLSVVDTHFHHRTLPANAQLPLLEKIFRNYSDMVTIVLDPDKFFGNDLKDRPATDKLIRAWAHAPIGGFHNGVDEPKVWFRKIFAEVKGPKCRVAMIIHECAHSAARAVHFASDNPRKRGTPDDPFGSGTHARNYEQLTPDEASRNACTYACFAANAMFRNDIGPGAHDLDT
jgi:hypothetical protein